MNKRRKLVIPEDVLPFVNQDLKEQNGKVYDSWDERIEKLGWIEEINDPDVEKDDTRQAKKWLYDNFSQGQINGSMDFTSQEMVNSFRAGINYCRKNHATLTDLEKACLVARTIIDLEMAKVKP